MQDKYKSIAQAIAFYSGISLLIIASLLWVKIRAEAVNQHQAELSPGQAAIYEVRAFHPLTNYNGLGRNLSYKTEVYINNQRAAEVDRSKYKASSYPLIEINHGDILELITTIIEQDTINDTGKLCTKIYTNEPRNYSEIQTQPEPLTVYENGGTKGGSATFEISYKLIRIDEPKGFRNILLNYKHQGGKVISFIAAFIGLIIAASISFINHFNRK